MDRIFVKVLSASAPVPNGRLYAQTVSAECIGPLLYRLTGSLPENTVGEFATGQVVRCEKLGSRLLAIERVGGE